MIAKILPKSGTFAAITYNETKVNEGVAELIDMNGLGVLENLGGDRTAEATRRFFVEYSKSNERIKYAQFHVILSCKGDEMDKERLLASAKEYMSKMGYDLSKIPYLVYFHRDTDNKHVHVITSRVDPNGRKIDHNHERVRSQRAITEMMGIDVGEKSKHDLESALNFKFETVGQFMAVMESMGYECYEQGEELNVKKGGVVLTHIPIEEIARKARKKIPENAKRTKQLRQLFNKYHNLSYDKDEFARQLKDMFGISIVFVGKKDNPYGYMVIDNRFKTVYKGWEIMKIKDLLSFKNIEDRRASIARIIGDCLEVNPKTTTKSINSILRRQFGTGISNGSVRVGWGNAKWLYLSDDVLEKLRFNDRMAWIQKFKPASEIERDVLTSLFKVSPSDITMCNPEAKNIEKVCETVDAIRGILEESQNMREALDESRIILYKVGNNHVAVDMARHTIVTLSDFGIVIGENGRMQRVGQEPKANKQRQMSSSRVGGGGKTPKLPSASGQASDSVNHNPEDSRKTDWSKLAGEDGLSR